MITRERADARDRAGAGVDLDLFAPAGQQVFDLAGVAAQLGLDGRTYALQGAEGDPSEAPEGGAASRYLGPVHGLSGGNPNQLELPELSPNAIRFQRQWGMSDLLGPEKNEQGEIDQTTGERCAKCHKVRRETGGETQLHCDEFRRWSFAGLVICGNAQVCPMCAFKKARKVSAAVSAAIAKHLRSSMWADVWMLTLTLPHYAGDSQRESIARLKKAWSTFTQSGPWRRFKAQWGIEATLRVFDCTFGDNGLHAHWHVGLFVERAAWGLEQSFSGMDADTRRAVLDGLADDVQPAWERAAEKAGAVTDKNREAFRLRGLSIDGAEKAAQYFCKWGLADELGMGAVKTQNQFALLDRARDGDVRAGELFREFYFATKGLPVVTGLKALRKYVALTDDEVRDHIEALKELRDKQRIADGAEPPPPPIDPFTVSVQQELFPIAIRVGWPAVQEAALAALDAGECPQAAVDHLLENGGTDPPGG